MFYKPAQRQDGRHRNGFTLVELMVVIGLLGVLSLIGMTVYTTSQQRARDARRKTDMETLRQAVELYKADNNAYPNYTGRTDLTGFKNLLSPTYLSSTNFPTDPQFNTTRTYYYQRTANTTYNLCARLEKPVPGVDAVCGNLINSDCNTSTGTQNDCNYGVTQP